MTFRVYRLIYISLAAYSFTEDDLNRLLEGSRANNRSCGVTGMLVYVGDSFIQALEGEQSAVVQTYGRILEDSRHADLVKILEGSIQEREYTDWPMGFIKMEGSYAESLPGYNDFVRSDSDASKKRSALQLLENFKKLRKEQIEANAAVPSAERGLR